MKRLLLPLVVILLLAGAGIYFQRRIAPHARQVATWLPGDTILFEDIPDIHRTTERWPETELAQIIDEPEVQTFLERPMGEIPHRADLDQWLSQLRRIDPLHLFIAATAWNGSGFPSTIAGLYFTGSRQDMDAMVDNVRKKAQQTWPEGKSDIEKYGAGDIETFTTPGFTAALAFRGPWFFISSDEALLKATLDRFEGQRDPNSLAELPAFTSTLQHLPPAADSIFFLRPALLADQAASFALMLNPTADTHAADAIKKIDSVGLALKLDGDVMRDALYVVKSAPADETPLARDSLKLSSQDTIILTSARLGTSGPAQLPDAKSDPSGLLSLLNSYVKIFADQGLHSQQYDQAFGPESGFILDWPSAAVIPTPLVTLDVRDPKLARKFLDTLATLPLAAGVEFTHQDAGPISLYTLPSTGIGFFPIQVTLGLTDKTVIAALSVDSVKQAALRQNAHASGLDATEGYKKAAALVSAPTTSFVYVDVNAVFGRIYGLFRGVATMGFIPHLSEYIDLGKLPAPETITRHLTPIVASGSVKDGGLLTESAGPITTIQATMVGAALLGAAAVPMMEQQIKGQPVTIPGFPGLTPKPAPAPQFQSLTPSSPAPSTSP
jgi:hypothetical protein